VISNTLIASKGGKIFSFNAEKAQQKSQKKDHKKMNPKGGAI